MTTTTTTRAGRVPARDRNGKAIDCVSWDAVAQRFEIQVMVDGLRKSKRMPAGTSPSVLEETRDDIKAALRLKAKQQDNAPAAGTLAADARVFIDAWTGVNRQQLTYRIMLWVHALGPKRKRDSITKADISTQLATWGSDGFVKRKGSTALQPYSVESRRKLQRVLRQMFDMLGGANPAREVRMLPKPKPEPRALDIAVAETLLDSMAPSVTRARLRMMLRLGITQTELMRLQRVHVDTRRGRITILARRKGAGAEARVLPYGMMPDAVAAVDELASYNVWGEPFSMSVLANALKRATAALDMSHVRPYDMRHTCATELYRRTSNIRMVQKWLGHTNVETTVRYILGGDDDQLVAAAAAMNAASTARKRRNDSDEQEVAV